MSLLINKNIQTKIESIEKRWWRRSTRRNGIKYELVHDSSTATVIYCLLNWREWEKKLVCFFLVISAIQFSSQINEKPLNLMIINYSCIFFLGECVLCSALGNRFVSNKLNVQLNAKILRKFAIRMKILFRFCSSFSSLYSIFFALARLLEPIIRLSSSNACWAECIEKFIVWENGTKGSFFLRLHLLDEFGIFRIYFFFAERNLFFERNLSSNQSDYPGHAFNLETYFCLRRKFFFYLIVTRVNLVINWLNWFGR